MKTRSKGYIEGQSDLLKDNRVFKSQNQETSFYVIATVSNKALFQKTRFTFHISA